MLVERIRTADELFGEAVRTPGQRTVLLGLLGGFGLVLALVGVFATTAYVVAGRTAEIGVRMTFGARPDQVVAAVVRDAAAPILVGTAAGVLAVSGVAAAVVPASRAAQVDPVLTLRAE